MTRREFAVHVRQPHPRVSVIDLHGEITSAAEPALTATYAQALAQATPGILLNFSDVDYINSTGIALVVSFLSQTRAAQRTLMACGLSEHYIEIFRITRLAEYMQVFPNEASALQSHDA